MPGFLSVPEKVASRIVVVHNKRASSVTEIITVRKITQEVDKAPSPWQYLVEGIDIQKNYA